VNVAGDERPRVIGEFSDYDGLITALRARAAELNLSGESIDVLAGLTARHSQKLLGPHQIRRLGATSMGPFFGALAVRGVLLEDRAALARLRSRITPRNGSYVRPTYTHVIITDRKWRQIQKLGHQARRAVWHKLTPQQRSEVMRVLAHKRMAQLTAKQRRELARKAALARWRGSS
jgi:hypothetical protein